MQQLNEWLSRNYKNKNFNLKIQTTTDRIYPNVCAPIAGIIDYYKGLGMKINVSSKPKSYAFHTKFWNPHKVESTANSDICYPLDKVWTFETSEGVNKLVNALILALRQSDTIEPGVIKSVEWCTNEVMDNVLQHSKSGKGYVMAQIQKQAKIFSFCVYDCGIGIYNSLKDTKYHPEKPIDAITLALQERITRDESIGQGNGLWGLSNIVKDSNGNMEISSGGAKYCYNGGKIKTIKEGGFVLSRGYGTSFIDVQINYDKEINIFNSLGGYEPLDLWLENLEDENDNYVLKVAELSSGTGTRQAAQKLKNIALNISNIEKKIVIFDFNGINLISSSFADELIGKLINEKGLYYFMSAFKITHLSAENIAVLNRSVEQRMAYKFYSQKNKTKEIKTVVHRKSEVKK